MNNPDEADCGTFRAQRCHTERQPMFNYRVQHLPECCMIAPLRKAIGYCTLPRGPWAIAHSGEEDSVNRMQSVWRRRRREKFIYCTYCTTPTAAGRHRQTSDQLTTPAVNITSKYLIQFFYRQTSNPESTSDKKLYMNRVRDVEMFPSTQTFPSSS